MNFEKEFGSLNDDKIDAIVSRVQSEIPMAQMVLQGPLEESFKEKGIGRPYHIILYSRNGLQWATRVWWMSYVLGYTKVSVLDGGFHRWKKL